MWAIRSPPANLLALVSRAFRRPAGEAEIVKNRPDEFARALTEHLLTYALGRRREWFDQAAVEQIVEALREDGYRFSRLAVEIAQSRRSWASAPTPRPRFRKAVGCQAEFDEPPRNAPPARPTL